MKLEVTICDLKLGAYVLKRHIYFALACLLLVRLLTGCAGSAGLQTSMLEEVRRKSVCCETLLQMEFRPLALGKSSIEMDTSLPTFQFDTGRSVFGAFSLPSNSGDLKIVIRSFSHAGYGGLFQPDLLLLDSSLNIRRRIPKPLFGRIPTSPIPLTPGFVQFEFNVDEADKFLIIRTTDELVAQSTSVRERALMPTGAATVVPISVVGAILSRPMGRIELEVSLTHKVQP